YAKANPRKINIGSPGIASGPHIAGELFKMMAGVDIVQVHYRGGAPVMTDLLGGQGQVLFGTTSLTLEQIQSGRFRASAVTTAARWEGLSDIPTVNEFIPGYEASSVFGLGAPRNTPTEIIERLNKEANAGLADSKINARLTELGGIVLPGSPVDFGKLLVEETEKWGKVIRAANIKPE